MSSQKLLNPIWVICSIDLSTKLKMQQVHAKWALLPLEDMEALEKMLIEAHFNDPITSVKAKLADLDKKTGVLLRLVQRLIEHTKLTAHVSRSFPEIMK